MTRMLGALKAALADRYRIEREVGAGGMATVYLAHDLKHDRKVAVKVLRPELAAALGHERFLREITTTANLRHPHILPLYDSGQTGGAATEPPESSAISHRPSAEFLFYVMPYVEGESLRDRLNREKQLPVDDALQIAREVADALSYAHSRGVIHRDIKPENILLESGHAVVADFGIARAVDAAGGDRLTETGLSIGTPTYMSPEQAAGAADLDGRSDLYALGCVLHEMLAGQPPFTGPSVESVIHQHLTVDPAPITNVRPAVPADVAGVLQRVLAKTPADRFSPAAQFAEALSRGAVSAATPAPQRRSTIRTWPVAAAVVVLVAAVGVGFLRRQSEEAPVPVVTQTTQVTRAPGLEVDPAISPDGQFAAYAAGAADRLQIVVRQVAGGRTVTLTDDSSRTHRWPRWSPDGTRIAFHADDGVFVVPALGGAPRLVARSPEVTAAISAGAYTPITGLAWSPDGEHIAFAGNLGSAGLYVTPAEGGDLRTLNSPREPHSPAWSPDGRWIAVASSNSGFVFGGVYFGNQGVSSVWLVPADGEEPVRVTEDAFLDGSPQWSPDGQHLFFVSDRGGSPDVYRVRVSTRGTPVGEPVRLTTGLDAQTITLSADGTRLAYARLRSSSNVWGLPVPRTGPVPARGVWPITTGDQTIEDVDVTADGRWLVFDSDRNGNSDLYVLPTDGGEPTQITTDPAGDFGAVWSPDGRLIAFHSLRTGNRDLFTIGADGTALTRRTSTADDELDPDWSPDGRSLAAERIDHGPPETVDLVVIPIDGADAAPRRLGAIGDFVQWSPAGDQIAYHALDGLEVISPDGGTPQPLTSNDADGAEAFYGAWAPDGSRLYYLARGGEGWTIRAVDRDGGPSRLLVRFEDPAVQPTRYGFATDGRNFYFTMGSHESDVWVLDLEGR